MSGSIITQHVRGVSAAAQRVLDTRRQMRVLDSSMSYLDTGRVEKDNAVVFLHGNPTAAYLWRNIMPHVQGIARCIAPDLIGMGHSGKSPGNKYRFRDHYRYLSAWFDEMDLPKKFTLVVHDWGSGLGFHWANEHQNRVQGIVFMEALVQTMPSWDGWPDVARDMFQALRSEGGEDMVLQKNMFVERLLPGSIMRQLTEEEMEEYRMPFKEEGESRRPTLTFPREIPICGEPADVNELTNNYNKWLSTSADVPKLYVDGEPGFFSKGIRHTVKDWPNLQTTKVKGLHFLQEDSPDEIGQAIKSFLLKIYN